MKCMYVHNVRTTNKLDNSFFVCILWSGQSLNKRKIWQQKFSETKK